MSLMSRPSGLSYQLTPSKAACGPQQQDAIYEICFVDFARESNLARSIYAL